MKVDVHCHLHFPDFNEDIDKVVERAKEENFYAIISNGLNPESNRKTIELSKKFPLIKPALGFYPIDVEEQGLEEVKKEIEIIKKEKVFAIGEVGLDYKYGKKIELQKEAFRLFIKLSKDLNKPIIIHSRKAEEDVIKILEEENAKKVILHFFSGNFKLVKKAYDLGFYFSIPTNIHKSQHFQRLAKEVPLSRLFTETDAPFISPSGGRNEPINIKHSLKEIAKIKKQEVNEVENQIFLNFQRVFLG